MKTGRSMAPLLHPVTDTTSNNNAEGGGQNTMTSKYKQYTVTDDTPFNYVVQVPIHPPTCIRLVEEGCLSAPPPPKPIAAVRWNHSDRQTDRQMVDRRTHRSRRRRALSVTSAN